MAKNVSVIALLAAVKRGFLKKLHVEHRVVGVQLPEDERADGDDADDERRRARRVGSSPWPGPR